VTTELARVEGSMGWTAMIGMGSGMIASLLPLEAFARIYERGPDVVLAGSSQPMGTAEPVPGGWRVTGRWPFASGCQHAEWMLAFCIMTKDGKPVAGSAGDDGPPLVRGFILPASEWQIEDTWHVAGLSGTGSHHIAIKDKFVPATSFFDVENPVSCVPGPLYHAPLDFLPLMHSAFAVGAAQGAIDELVDLANTGRKQMRAATAMRDSEMFQGELGRAEADLRAAQALLEVQAATHWRHALAGTIKDGALGLQSTQTAVWISAACTRVADACFALAGGSAVYNASPLQRRLRDIHVSAQHGLVQQRHYAAVGKRRLDGNPNAAAH
jgi:alkylation response protein AidB-like acyl-CoA dehydrogenase